jgi:hypothetical protein
MLPSQPLLIASLKGLALDVALRRDDALVAHRGRDQLDLVADAAEVLRRDGEVLGGHLDAGAAGLRADAAVGVEPVGGHLRAERHLLGGAGGERLADAAQEVVPFTGLLGGALVRDRLLLGRLDALLREGDALLRHGDDDLEDAVLLERGDQAVDAVLAQHAAGVQQPADLDAGDVGLQEGAEAVVGLLLRLRVLREGELLHRRLHDLPVDRGDGVGLRLLARLALLLRGLALRLLRLHQRGAAGQADGREAATLVLVGRLDAGLEVVELRAHRRLGEDRIALVAVGRGELADVHDAGAVLPAELVLQHDRLLALLADLGAVDDGPVADDAVVVLHALVALGAGGAGVVRHSFRFLSLRNWGC